MQLFYSYNPLFSPKTKGRTPRCAVLCFAPMRNVFSHGGITRSYRSGPRPALVGARAHVVRLREFLRKQSSLKNGSDFLWACKGRRPRRPADYEAMFVQCRRGGPCALPRTRYDPGLCHCEPVTVSLVWQSVFPKWPLHPNSNARAKAK